MSYEFQVGDRVKHALGIGVVTYVIPEFKGDSYFLSNFYRHKQHFTTATGEHLSFPTAEHVFQAAKYKALTGTDKEKADYVMQINDAANPSKARTLGRSVKGLDTDAWDGMKIDVMRQVLLDKFAGGLVERLLATGDAMLVEGNTHGDTFWGRCDKKGYNMLGVLLMEIRGYHRLHNDRWPDLPPPENGA